MKTLLTCDYCGNYFDCDYGQGQYPRQRDGYDCLCYQCACSIDMDDQQDDFDQMD